MQEKTPATMPPRPRLAAWRGLLAFIYILVTIVLIFPPKNPQIEQMWDDIIIANLSWKWVCIFAIGAVILDSLLWLIRHHSWSLFGILMFLLVPPILMSTTADLAEISHLSYVPKLVLPIAAYDMLAGNASDDKKFFTVIFSLIGFALSYVAIIIIMFIVGFSTYRG